MCSCREPWAVPISPDTAASISRRAWQTLTLFYTFTGSKHSTIRFFSFVAVFDLVMT